MYLVGQGWKMRYSDVTYSTPVHAMGKVVPNTLAAM